MGELPKGKHGRWDIMSFDIDLRARGTYNSKFGQAYLRLKQEYNVDGARLVKRVFEDADTILAFRLERKAEALRKKDEADRELRRLVVGSQTKGGAV